MSKRPDRISPSHGHQTYLVSECTQIASLILCSPCMQYGSKTLICLIPIVVAQFKCTLLSPPSFVILDLIVPNERNHLPNGTYSHYWRMLDNVAQMTSNE